MSRRSCAISSIDIYSRIADRGGQVAPPAANPSQATGRVKRHDNQLHRARVLEVRIQSPPAESPLRTHAGFHLGSTAQRIHHTTELDEQPFTWRLYEPAIVRGNRRINQPGPDCF